MVEISQNFVAFSEYMNFNFQLFGLLSVLFQVRMKWTAKLHRPEITAPEMTLKPSLSAH